MSVRNAAFVKTENRNSNLSVRNAQLHAIYDWFQTEELEYIILNINSFNPIIKSNVFNRYHLFFFEFIFIFFYKIREQFMKIF